VVGNIEREKEEYEVFADDALLLPSLKLEGEDNMEEWGGDETKSFFVEYRLQRDRVREQEKEMLRELIDNPNASSASKTEAEKLLLSLVETMEKELLIENIIRAQGFSDALFFYRNNNAMLMIKTEDLSEREFVQITDMVSGIIGTSRETVQVIIKK
jgi:stage III sporulation protein AH